MTAPTVTELGQTHGAGIGNVPRPAGTAATHRRSLHGPTPRAAAGSARTFDVDPVAHWRTIVQVLGGALATWKPLCHALLRTIEASASRPQRPVDEPVAALILAR